MRVSKTLYSNAASKFERWARGYLKIVTMYFRCHSSELQKRMISMKSDSETSREERVSTGAHHPEPPSPIQTLWDNLCAYLSIFRNCGTFRLARTICYTVQYNTMLLVSSSSKLSGKGGMAVDHPHPPPSSRGFVCGPLHYYVQLFATCLWWKSSLWASLTRICCDRGVTGTNHIICRDRGLTGTNHIICRDRGVTGTNHIICRDRHESHHLLWQRSDRRESHYLPWQRSDTHESHRLLWQGSDTHESHHLPWQRSDTHESHHLLW